MSSNDERRAKKPLSLKFRMEKVLRGYTTKYNKEPRVWEKMPGERVNDLNAENMFSNTNKLL